MQLVKLEVDHFSFEASKKNIDSWLLCFKEDETESRLWFHLNPYNFDSNDELELFRHIRRALNDKEKIKDIYFTGATTDPNKTDFYFEYEIYKDNELNMGKYFPDLLVEVE
jgi:hypothetical protein